MPIPSVFQRLTQFDAIVSLIERFWLFASVAGSIVGAIWVGISSWTEGLSDTQVVVLQLGAAASIGLLVFLFLYFCKIVIQLIQKRSSKTILEEKPLDTFRRDIPLRNAVFYWAYEDWKPKTMQEVEESTQEQIDGLYKSCTIFWQAARDGEITIWGRPNRNSPLNPISPEYWQYYGFEAFFFFHDDPRKWRTERKQHVRTNQPIYYELMTSKAQIERLWHAENT